MGYRVINVRNFVCEAEFLQEAMAIMCMREASDMLEKVLADVPDDDDPLDPTPGVTH